MREDYFKTYKYFKLVQLAVLVVFAITFFCFLYFDKDLHKNIYTNRSLLTICVFLWAFMIYSLAAIIWDFKQLEGNIVHDFALSRVAYVDSLTGIPNRYSCDRIFEKYGEGSDISKMGCALIAISNLGPVNKSRGRKTGDALLRDFSAILGKASKKYGFVGRNSGNEFLFVMEETDDARMKEFISALNGSIEEYNSTATDKIEVKTSYILNVDLKTNDFSELIGELYKTSGRG